MRVVYSPHYEIDLPGHVWPTQKYRLIAERLLSEEMVGARAIVEPEPCAWDDLALAHRPEYLHRIRTGTLTEDEIRTLELPWVPALVECFRLMAGGTCLAAEFAVQDGAAVHLGGGLHHAFAGHGEGFCLFNDVAVAIKRLQGDGRIARAAVVDCDVHHGNGTAAIFSSDPSVFTFSIHQQHNYPLYKPPGDLDIGLPDATGDREYLQQLNTGLEAAMKTSPELVVYLAGADPFERDRLGGLALTFDGLRARDGAVFAAARGARASVVVVLAGGYAADVADTVAAHVGTIRELLQCQHCRNH